MNPDQLHLALQILFNQPITLSETEQRDLLQADETESLPQAALAVLAEALLALLQRATPPPPIDSYAVAYALLRQIEAAGGQLPPRLVTAQPELLQQFFDQAIVARSLNGLIWGPRARAFLVEYLKDSHHD